LQDKKIKCGSCGREGGEVWEGNGNYDIEEIKDWIFKRKKG